MDSGEFPKKKSFVYNALYYLSQIIYSNICFIYMQYIKCNMLRAKSPFKNKCDTIENTTFN